MLRYVDFLVALIAVAAADKLEVEPCTGANAQTGTLTEVYSHNFTTGEDIELLKGGVYVFGVKFTARENSPLLEPTIYGIIGGIKVGWNGVNKEACQDLLDTNKCPVVSGRTYHYYTSIEILNSYPSTRMTFQWGITAKNASGTKGKNHICFTMPARIR